MAVAGFVSSRHQATLMTGLAPARVGFSTMGRGLRQSVHVQLLMYPSSSGQGNMAHGGGNPAPAAAHPFLSLLSPPRYRSGLPKFYVAARMMAAKIQTLELLSGGGALSLVVLRTQVSLCVRFVTSDCQCDPRSRLSGN
jgi:hypothetical protein